MDDVVMGPTYCAYDNCTDSLKNARGGVFCRQHGRLCGNLCHMHDCNNPKAPPSHTCTQHQDHWYQHVIQYGRQSLLGIHRFVRHSAEEHLAWLLTFNRQVQHHDEEHTAETQKDNYFVAPCFYYCAPCGVVIAWTKFAKAESPINILNFLDSVYPTSELQPNYICINKTCMVL